MSPVSGSRIHAPNEHIRLDGARRAIKAFAAMMLRFGAVARRPRRTGARAARRP